MSTEIDFVVRQSAFRMHASECADAVDDKAVVGDRGLEPLQPVPWNERRQFFFQKNLNAVAYHSQDRRTRHAVVPEVDGEQGYVSHPYFASFFSHYLVPSRGRRTYFWITMRVLKTKKVSRASIPRRHDSKRENGSARHTLQQ